MIWLQVVLMLIDHHVIQSLEIKSQAIAGVLAKTDSFVDKCVSVPYVIIGMRILVKLFPGYIF